MIDYNILSEEYVKCYSDKTRIYMIENYLKTYDATQRRQVPYQLFPRQKMFCEKLATGNNCVCQKPRQCGATTTGGAFIACECVLAEKTEPLTILVIGNTLDLAQQMVTKIRDFLYQFPAWMWGEEFITEGVDPTKPPTKKQLFDICNTKELVLKNGCRVVARSSGPDASRGVGGVSFLVFDEAAFIENGKDVYASAIPTVSTGGHIIMISTPNGKDALYYETCRRASLKGTEDWNNFELVEFKWYQDPRYNKYLEWTRKNEENGEYEIYKEPTIDKKGNIKYDDEHWTQMVKDGWKPRAPWYVKMCQQFNNDAQKIAQELDVSFLGSDSTVVGPEFIQMQMDLNVREPDPNYKDSILDDMWIWKPPYEGHRYILACLPEGEKVLTDEGLKNIEDVTLVNKLVNKDGQYVKVNTTKSRMVHEEIIVEYELSNIFDKVKFTWNHPIWSSTNNKIIRPHKKLRKRIFDFKFNKSIDVNVGDWIEIPNTYRKKTLTNDEIKTKWEKYNSIGRDIYRIENPLLNEDFWWYCGMWLAEGWCYTNKSKNKTITTAHNKNESEIIDKIKKICTNLFGRNITMRYGKDDNGVILFFNNKQVADFLTDNFGKYAKNKQIPEWVKFLPENFKINLLKGYLQGDGCISNGKIQIVSVSKSLLMDVQDIFFSLGIISTLCLSSKEKFVKIAKKKYLSHCSEKYTLNCGKIDTKKFLDISNIENNISISFSRHPISNCYFSDNLEYIYIQIRGKKTYKYSGRVFNFDCETHTFCGNKIATHNCDNSRGSSDDATALEIIDLDGINDDGLPCVEQVAEYNGKLTGDAIGEIAYNYGLLYNTAFIVVEDIGGYGSATLLTLMNLKYPNLYYDDPNLKKYTSQEDATPTRIDLEKGLPGFHSSSVRFQMLSHFANLVKTNQFKIRSKRVITELDTWIFKNGRIDHKDGCHDDTLTCLAMGLFVMEYSMNKQMEAKQKDMTMLRAMINVNNRINIAPSQNNSKVNITPILVNKPKNENIYASNMWLFK